MTLTQACEILGVSQDIEERELKRAYARLLKEYHPEEHPAKFIQIQEAYQYLLNYKNKSIGIFEDPISISVQEFLETKSIVVEEKKFTISESPLIKDDFKEETDFLSLADTYLENQEYYKVIRLLDSSSFKDKVLKDKQQLQYTAWILSNINRMNMDIKKWFSKQIVSNGEKELYYVNIFSAFVTSKKSGVKIKSNSKMNYEVDIFNESTNPLSIYTPTIEEKKKYLDSFKQAVLDKNNKLLQKLLKEESFKYTLTNDDFLLDLTNILIINKKSIYNSTLQLLRDYFIDVERKIPITSQKKQPLMEVLLEGAKSYELANGKGNKESNVLKYSVIGVSIISFVLLIIFSMQVKIHPPKETPTQEVKILSSLGRIRNMVPSKVETSFINYSKLLNQEEKLSEILESTKYPNGCLVKKLIKNSDIFCITDENTLDYYVVKEDNEPLFLDEYIEVSVKKKEIPINLTNPSCQSYYNKENVIAHTVICWDDSELIKLEELFIVNSNLNFDPWKKEYTLKIE